MRGRAGNGAAFFMSKKKPTSLSKLTFDVFETRAVKQVCRENGWPEKEVFKIADEMLARDRFEATTQVEAALLEVIEKIDSVPTQEERKQASKSSDLGELLSD